MGRQKNELLALGYMLQILRRFTGPRWTPECIQLPGMLQGRRKVEEIFAGSLTAGECAAVIFPADLMELPNPSRPCNPARVAFKSCEPDPILAEHTAQLSSRGRGKDRMSEINMRVADYPIDPQFLKRWSPRAFTGEPVPESELRTMFEAARWAPSSSNRQPWRFLYGLGGTQDFEKFLALLNEGNRIWAKHAGALIILISKMTSEVSGSDKPVFSRTHSFDAGAAWAFFALEAVRLGWAAHAMAGFDVARTMIDLNVPENYRPEAAIAVGRQGDKSLLPERLREREAPNGRHPQRLFVFSGGFPDRVNP